jgi:lipid-binding SYLF domain-containing protein
MNGDFKLTGQLAAAGPTGNGYNASAGWQAPILSYSRSHEAYAGADIQGSTISVDQGAMHNVCGSSETEHKVLDGSVKTPPQAQSFTNALPGNVSGNMH